jgi:hypothetical protein
MTEQMRLNVEAEAPIRPVGGQWRQLPGSTWEDIFDTPVAADDADAPITRSNSQEGGVTSCMSAAT